MEHLMCRKLVYTYNSLVTTCYNLPLLKITPVYYNITFMYAREMLATF